MDGEPPHDGAVHVMEVVNGGRSRVFHHEPRLGRLARSSVAVGRVHARRTGQVEPSGSEDIDLTQRCVLEIVVQRKNEGHHARFIAQRR